MMRLLTRSMPARPAVSPLRVCPCGAREQVQPGERSRGTVTVLCGSCAAVTR